LKDKKQNPALLIATLGVYLGLVLAGAAPAVLANAALTKQFDVRDEIEFVDEFDNKPDDTPSPLNKRSDKSLNTYSVSATNLPLLGLSADIPSADFSFESSRLWHGAVGDNFSHFVVMDIVRRLDAEADLYSARELDATSKIAAHASPVVIRGPQMIVTRLPRAFLDAPVTSDQK
jgi:hypothetical protein